MVNRIEQNRNVMFVNSVSPFFLLTSLIAGCALGLFIALDPLLVNILANQVDIVIEGKNILKLYPYELSSFLILPPLFLLLINKLVNIACVQPEKAFIIFFVISFQTIALAKISFLDGSDLVVFCFGIIFLLKMMVKNEKARVTLLDILNMAIVVAIFISSVNGGIGALSHIVLPIKMMIFSFLLANVIYKHNLLHFFFKWLIIMTVVSSVIAIFQEIIYLLTDTLVVGFIEPKALRFMFEKNSLGTFLRVPAFITSYKTFAFLLIISLIIILNYFLYNPPQGLKNKAYIYISSGLMLIALMLTFSKDSMIGLGCGVLLALIIRRPSWAIPGFAIFLVIVPIMYITGLYSDIYHTIMHEISWGEQRIRIQLNSDGLSGLLNNHTWIGTGLTKGDIYTSHFLGWSAHNNIILAADELGVVGLVMYILPIVYSLFNALSLSLYVTGPADKAIARGLLCGFISLLIVFQTHSGYFDIVLWMYMGVIQAMVMLRKSHGRP